MNETERYINGIMPLIYPMMMSIALNVVDGICREFITSKLEAKLGRPLTWYDWQVYQQEQAERQHLQAQAAQQEQVCATWNSFQKQLQQLAADREKTHNFVWGIATESQPVTYETLLAAASKAIKNGKGEE